MSLPTTAANIRALDAKCSNPLSDTCKLTILRLSKLPAASRLTYYRNSASLDCAHLVRCLLAAGVPIDARLEEDERTAVMFASLHGSARVLKFLLAAGADHSLVEKTTLQSALHFSLRTDSDDLACARLLLEFGASADAQDGLGNTVLMNACMEQRAERVALLLPISNLLATNNHGQMAFHVAAGMGNEECFELLLPLMNDVDIRTVEGTDVMFNSTALHLACANGQHAIAITLLKHGADRMARESRHRTPLHYAALGGHLNCATLLVGREGKVKMTPAEVNAADSEGVTALHCCAQGGYTSVCGVLLAAGARLDATCNAGATPLLYALRFQPSNSELLEVLSGQGPAQLPGTVCDHCGKTAEQAAVSYLKLCAGGDARYCSQVCSLAAWPGHKAACKARRKEVDERAAPNLLGPPAFA